MNKPSMAYYSSTIAVSTQASDPTGESRSGFNEDVEQSRQLRQDNNNNNNGCRIQPSKEASKKTTTAVVCRPVALRNMYVGLRVLKHQGGLGGLGGLFVCLFKGRWL